MLTASSDRLFFKSQTALKIFCSTSGQLFASPGLKIHVVVVRAEGYDGETFMRIYWKFTSYVLQSGLFINGSRFCPERVS